jgi:hypothetical protein
MFDAALAFDRYRLEVVQGWPDGDEKTTLLAAIRFSLVAKNPREGRQEIGAQLEKESIDAVKTGAEPYR